MDRLELCISSYISNNHLLTDDSIILSSEFYHFVGDDRNARRELNMLKAKYGDISTNLDAIILSGWINHEDKDDSIIIDTISMFPNALHQNPRLQPPIQFRNHG